jgi:DmsE family decaheme c-type cytochrome
MHRSSAGTVAVSLALWAAALVAMATLDTRVVTARAAPTPQAAPVQPATAPAAPQAGYAGDDTCLTCHTDQAALKGTPHGRVANPRAPAAKQGCETCHGPGQAHVDDEAKGHIVRFTKLAAADVNGTCVTCHTRGPHALWSGSQHDARNLSCIACHSVHTPKSPVRQLKAASELELCATCHKPQTFKVNRSAHMPVRDGKMTCSSCHNPHGATNVRLLKTGNWINESCAACHAEKRGPFLCEHAAGRESCVSCHDPHGSSNERMLVAKVPMLCQRCHIGTRHPSTIYDGASLAAKSSRLIGRGCVNCHSNIHGSNHPSGATFLR